MLVRRSGELTGLAMYCVQWCRGKRWACGTTSACRVKSGERRSSLGLSGTTTHQRHRELQVRSSSENRSAVWSLAVLLLAPCARLCDSMLPYQTYTVGAGREQNAPSGFTSSLTCAVASGRRVTSVCLVTHVVAAGTAWAARRCSALQAATHMTFGIPRPPPLIGTDQYQPGEWKRGNSYPVSFRRIWPVSSSPVSYGSSTSAVCVQSRYLISQSYM